MNYGFSQKFNPHSLRVGVIKDFDSSWHNESEIIGYDSRSYLKEKFNNISLYSLGLFERKIKLVKVLGKGNYKKLVSNIKVLSR